MDSNAELWDGVGMDADEQTKIDQAQEVIKLLSPEACQTLLLRLISEKTTADDLAASIDQLHINDVDSVAEALDDFPTALPNPWVGLPIADPDKEGRPLFKSTNPFFTAPFEIKLLPNEIILNIAECLPRESAICLAMSDHHMMALLGQEYVRPRELTICEQFNLVRLLERECTFSVACPSCLTLHLPTRHCHIHEMHDAVPLSPNFGNRMPLRANYNKVRAIAKQLASGVGGPKASFELLNAIGQTVEVCFPTVKAIRSTLGRFVDGDLVVRSQINIAGIDGGQMDRKAVSFIRQCLTTDAFQICDHCTWQSFMSSPEVNTNKRGPTWSQRMEFDWWFNSMTPDAAWDTFDQSSTQPSHVTSLGAELHPTLSRLLAWDHDSGNLSSCHKCLTDFGIGVQEVPGTGPVLVLSTWKNLGGPSDNDPYSKESAKRFSWDTHRYLAESYFRDGSLEILTGWPGRSEGSISKGFEAAMPGLKGWSTNPTAFKPEVEPYILRKLETLRYVPVDQETDKQEFQDFFAM